MNLKDLNLIFLRAASAKIGKAPLAGAANIIMKEAKREIGSYQPAAGQFPAWAPLTPETQDDRVNKGFSANNPLERTGELRNSIMIALGDEEANVGSDSDKAVWHEFGTMHTPPRSFLGGAVIRKDKQIATAIEKQIETQLKRIFS